MLLSGILFLPLIFSVLLIFMRGERAVRWAALFFGIVEFVLSLEIFRFFKKDSASLQLVERWEWIREFGVSYFVGVDGISIWLILLTTFLVPLIILASWNSIDKRVKLFHVCLFVLQTAMLGTFLSFDSILFYIFWELSLIPMYFMIGIWGGSRRIYATVKFFIFTMAGSVLMLLAIIYLIFQTREQLGYFSASLVDFYNLAIPYIGGDFNSPQTLLFFAFCLAFAIKVPLFPFHTWLPDAHVEAPTPGSVILAGVMLKMGTYGFLRFSIPLFPEAAQQWSWLFLAVATIGIVYGALVAMVQPDVKKLVAYSSVSHMGYILLGLFAFNVEGITGGLYQMLNHGISTGALFLLVGILYERTHNRQIADYGGLAVAMPIYTVFFFIITLSSIAVPMTNGFVGEYLILLGSFLTQKPFVFIAVSGVVLGAAYMLWMFKRIFFGPAGILVQPNSDHGSLKDLTIREIVVLVPFVGLIFWMGIRPNDFLEWSQSSIKHLVESGSSYQLTLEQEEADRSILVGVQKEERNK